MSNKTDFLSICLEEISLEGLDGITISALWIRLNDRKPLFPMKIDDEAKTYLWRVLAAQQDLSFYQLPNPRRPLVLYDRYQFTDPDTGICVERDNVPEDIYPIVIVKDGNIVGSCATYKTRKDVTAAVRNEDGTVIVSLDQAAKKWGEKLVMVASQEMRQSSLYGLEVDPSLVLTEKLYCVLERVGRSRWSGEVSQGQNSLQAFKESSKSLFYLRKVLLRHNLITMQVFNQKRLCGNNAVGKCIHLKRFFVERKPIYLGWLESLTQKLNQKPKKRELLSVIRSEMGLRETSFKKLYQLGMKYVATELVSYRDLYPESTEEEFLVKTKVKERFVRVMRLIKPYTYSLGGLGEDEDGGSSSGDEDVAAPDQKIDVWDQVVELPLLHQAYRFVRSRGECGTSQNQISRALGIGKLESRLVARNLERRNVVQKILQDKGKQRVQMFVVNDWMATSSLHMKLEEEKRKILEFSQLKQESTDSSRVTPQASPGGTPVPSAPASPAPSTSEKAKQTEYVDPPLIDIDFQAEKHHARKRGAHVTYRLLKRANLVLKAVKEAQLIDNLYYIQKKIIDEEQQEGLKSKLDKKSLIRLVERLAREGQIKSIKTLIKFGKDQKELHFLCDPSISASDPIVTSAIEAAKLRQMALSKEVSREIITKSKGSHEEPNLMSLDPDHPNYGLLKSQIRMEDMDYDPEAGRRYGHVPRMRRCQLVHELLWYLVYGFEKESADSESSQNESSEGQPGTNQYTLNTPRVYKDDNSWRRYIQPLPRHKGYPEGWCLIGDVLLRLPVAIFCQIIRVNFRITGLEEILKTKPNLTVSLLPSLMRQQLMIERKYIFSFFETCTCLCQMGLLSFGRREWKDKERIFIFLHQKASIIDSTMTDVPPEKRTIQEFDLSSEEYVQKYWFSLQWICLNTPQDAVLTQPVSTDEAGGISKTPATPARFQSVVKGKLPSEIVDDGSIPGNQLGAGGLDSIFWAHLRRNWSYMSSDVKMETLVSEGKRKLLHSGKQVVKKRVRRTPAALAIAVPPKRQFPGDLHGSAYKAARKAMLKRGKQGSGPGTSPQATACSSAVPSQNTEKSPVESSKPAGLRKILVETTRTGRGTVKRKIHKPLTALPPIVKKRRVDPKPPRCRKNELDDIDRAALRRMTKDRVGWTPQEDSLLLLCEVANIFMVGQRRDFIVPFSTVRDLMHENFVTSLDKTSKACQRRLRYILKNPQTLNNVNLYIGEALQDKSLVEEFQRDKKYVRSFSCAPRNCKVFRALLLRLREKFKAPQELGTQDLPDSLEEVYEKFQISHTPSFSQSKHQDVRNKRDIQFSVLHNVIHAAMVVQDKTGHAQELYQLFSQYPEDLLQDVFTRMRADGIVTKIKTPVANRKANQPTPMPRVAIGTYQMAQRYTYNWFSRYPKSIFLQSYQYLDKIGGMHRIKDMSSKAKSRKEGSRSNVPRSEVKDSDLVLEMKEDSGCVAVVVTLMALRKAVFQAVLPEKIVVVESSYLKKQKKRVTKSQATLEKELHLGTASDEEEEALIEEGEKWRQSKEGKNDDSEQIDDEELPMKVMSTSRMSLTLTRSQYSCSPLSVRMLAPQDHIVIHSCTVLIALKKSAHRANCQHPSLKWRTEYDCHRYLTDWNCKYQWMHPNTCTHVLNRIRVTQPRNVDVNAYITNSPAKFDFTAQEVDVMRDILNEVEKQGILGLSFTEMQAKFGSVPNLEKILGALKEYHIVSF